MAEVGFSSSWSHAQYSVYSPTLFSTMISSFHWHHHQRIFVQWMWSLSITWQSLCHNPVQTGLSKDTRSTLVCHLPLNCCGIPTKSLHLSEPQLIQLSKRNYNLYPTCLGNLAFLQRKEEINSLGRFFFFQSQQGKNFSSKDSQNWQLPKWASGSSPFS